MFIFDEKKDRNRFEAMCRYVLATVILPKYDERVSYVSVGCNKTHSVAWIHQLKSVLWQCAVYLKHLKPELSHDHKSMMLFLNMLLTFTSSTSWRIYEPMRPAMNQLCVNINNTLVTRGLLSSLQIILIKGLCRARPSLKKAELTAIVSIAMRQVSNSQFSEASVNLFLLHILSVPAIVNHLSTTSPETFKLFNTKKYVLFAEILKFLICEQNARILFNVLEGNYGLCLLANLVHLAHLEADALQAHIMDFVVSYNHWELSSLV